MTIINVKVPQLSESVAEATLLTWKKKVGDAVTMDEILIEVETDKVVLEVPAPSSGVLKQILKTDGQTVIADEIIANIDSAATAAVSAPAVTTIPVSLPIASIANINSSNAVPEANKSSAISIPSASKILAENNIKAENIVGSGKDGRITKNDAVQAVTNVSQQKVTPIIASSSFSGNRSEERVPMSRLRARIAERLLQSQQTNAILTTFNEVNMAAIIDIRKKYQEKFEKEHGVKLGFMSFFVKAAVSALQKYPILNASVDGNDIIYHGYFDIGIAVGSSRGLVVPILRNVEQMSFAEIEIKIAEFGQKAKEGKLSLDELNGGTFSISNGGVFGSMLSTPIINPPQAAILGIHATKDRAVVENGQIVIRPINYLAMSYDHRIIDGREAVLGLVAMKEALEDPTKLLFGI